MCGELVKKDIGYTRLVVSKGLCMCMFGKNDTNDWR